MVTALDKTFGDELTIPARIDTIDTYVILLETGLMYVPSGRTYRKQNSAMKLVESVCNVPWQTS